MHGWYSFRNPLPLTAVKTQSTIAYLVNEDKDVLGYYYARPGVPKEYV
jgi:hypothetical protein